MAGDGNLFGGLDWSTLLNADSGNNNSGGSGANPTTPTPTPTPTTPPVQEANPVTPTPVGSRVENMQSPYPAQVVPGLANPDDPSQINVIDYSGQMVGDPSLHFADDMQLSNRTPDIDPNTEGTNIEQQSPMDYSGTNANTHTVDQTAQASQVDPRQAVGYDTQQVQDAIAQDGQMEAQQGQVSDGALIDADDVQIDIDSHARGETELGKALLEHAEQDLNTVDAKATVKGQLAELQADFTGPNGDPIIPNWAQGAAREISKIAAFSGMTGSAATAAMSQAIMEASLPIATEDARFFQTLTLENLSNKQQSILNRANILSRFEEMNQDSRTAAAIQNAKNFMEMDLANLSNAQQSEIINTQARIQSILEDAKAVNTERMFEAQSQNDLNAFYDQMNSQIDQYNTTQTNAMAQFNSDALNGMEQFNSSLENQREQFYRDMQFKIDTANANWRQTVTLQDAQNKFEAAAVDVKNMVDLSTEQLNQIWDRADAMLDYIWKSTENELQRDNNIAVATLQARSQASLAQAQLKAGDKAGFGAILGSVAGEFAKGIAGKIFG